MSKPRRITELPLTTNPSISDLIPLAREGSNNRVTIGTILNNGFTTTLGDTTINGDLTVIGTETIVSSSVLYDSGSTIFGDSVDDKHDFIGDVRITGSLFVSGTTELGGDIYPQTPQGARLGTPENPFREIYLQSGSISIESDTPGDPSAEISNKDGNVSITTAGFQIVNDQIDKTVFRTTRGGRVLLTTRNEVYVTGSAMSIIGSDSGNEHPRNFNGTLLHLTNQEQESARMSIDSFGTGSLGEDRYPLIAGRRGRGTVDSPSAVKDDDTLFRIAVQGYGETDFVRSIGRFNISAREDFTDSAGGTKSSIWLTPIGSTTIQKVVEFNTDEVEITGSVDITGDYTLNGNSFSSSLFQSSSISGSVIEFTKGDNTTQQVQIPKGLGYSGLGWARYDDTTYTTSSPFSIDEGDTEILPCNGSGSIETHMHSSVPFFNPATQKIQAENDGDVYTVTINMTMRASSNPSEGDHVTIAMSGIGVTPYDRVRRDLFFFKNNTDWHYYHEIFQYYSDADFVANGNQFNLTASGNNIEVADVIIFIQRTQNHSQH